MRESMPQVWTFAERLVRLVLGDVLDALREVGTPPGDLTFQLRAEHRTAHP